MAKGQGQKRKLLALERILLECTDEDHPMTMEQLIGELERWGIDGERKSIYSDMEELRRCGVDVNNRRGKKGGWFVGERQFQLAELKLLVDAVQSSRFLTWKKSSELIAKLQGLASIHQGRQLQRQVYVDRRVKTMNESIYYNVDKLHAAIAADRMITFRYFVYDMEKQRVFRKGGKRYQASPCGLVWDSENYYLVAWAPQEKEYRHYRVDKMTEISVTGMPRDKRHLADMQSYTQKHFGMFSGQEGRVKLECGRELAGVVLDRFGQEIILVPEGEERFTVMLDVVVSPQFWGWVFGLGPNVRILAPRWAAEEYARRLREALEKMEL